MENTSPGARLIGARERTGKSAEQIANAAGLKIETYFDLERFNDLNYTVSLREIGKICRELGIAPIALFTDSATNLACRKHYSFGEISALIQEFMRQRNIPVSELEDIVGWELGAFLANSEAAWDWNIECLRDVCAPLGIDWLCALPR